MDTTITMRSSKAEMFAHIKTLELRCVEAAHERVALRTRISILEGTAALKQPLIPGQVVIERRGQSTTKRWMPAQR